MISIEEMDWIPVVGYPGYEVSGYGVVCKIKKDGSREILMPYRDKKPDRTGHKWANVTLYKNCQFFKVTIVDIMKSTWMPELERRKKQKEQKAQSEKKHKSATETVSQKKSERYVPDKKKKRTTDPAEQNRKFQQMIDGYEPDKMSVTAYMRYLREQGYRFTSSHLSAELSKKKRESEKEPTGLF